MSFCVEKTPGIFRRLLIEKSMKSLRSHPARNFCTGRTWSHARHDHEACAILVASKSYYNLQPWTCSHNIMGVRKLLGMSLCLQLFIDFGSRWRYFAAAYFARFLVLWCLVLRCAARCCRVLQGVYVTVIRGRVSGCCPKYCLLSVIWGLCWRKLK